MNIRRAIVLLLSAAFITMDVGAETSAGEAEWSDSTQWLGGVTVTAIKQTPDLSLQPFAATVIDRSQTEIWSVNSLKSVSEISPNFYMPDYGSRMTSSIYVRGIGSRMDNSAVGLTIDNVPFLNKNAYDFMLVDIDRIEVLRGPQSTLYGRNTMGGQINIYTIKPMDYQGSRVAATIGNGPTANLSLAHYAKFRPNLAMSFAGNFMFCDGFYKNAYNAKNVGAEKGGGLRWTTQWQVSPVLTADNTAAFNYSQQAGYAYEYVGSDLINYNDTCFYRRNTISDALTIKWLSDKFTLSSITSFQHITDNVTLDQDFLPMKYFTLTQAIHESSFTEDIVLRGDVRNYSWLAGVYGFYKHTSMRAPVTLGEDGISFLITDKVNKNDRIPIKLVFADANGPLKDIELNSRFKMSTYGLALYHQSSLELGRWSLTAGLRLDYESNTFDYESICHTAIEAYMKSGMPPRPILQAPIDIDETGKLDNDYVEFVPKFTVSYDLPMESGSCLYASVGKGYKSGGFNNQMFSEILKEQMQAKVMALMPGAVTDDTPLDVDEIVSYKPERSWNYEVGAHISCAEGRVMTDLDFFYIDLTNQQLTTFPAGTTTGRITTNAGKSRSFGAELQIRYAPVWHWSFNMSYGYTNAKFRSYIDGENDYKGKFVPYAPQHTLFLSAAYSHKVGQDWTFMYELNTRGVGRIYWNEANDVSQPFYLLPGASVRAKRDWIEVEGWIENFTGTKYTTFFFESIGNRFLQKGKPRLFGVTLRLNFDSVK